MDSKFLLKAAKSIFIDDTQQSVRVPTAPKRIVCLVPSITELLYSLGLGDKVVGITKFCVHPTEWRREKTIIGGTKNIKIASIINLQPDLVIASKEENIKEQVDELRKTLPVYTTDVTNYETALQMIITIGKLTGTNTKAAQLTKKIEQQWKKLVPLQAAKKTLYLIWRNPYMSVGGDSYIHSILTKAGFDNVCANKKRYPSIDEKTLQKLKPQVILLSSEPYPFKEKHISELQTILPTATIKLVDGEAFSWYGSRMLTAKTYIQDLINELQ